jgi:hypothetical protein
LTVRETTGYVEVGRAVQLELEKEYKVGVSRNYAGQFGFGRNSALMFELILQCKNVITNKLSFGM